MVDLVECVAERSADYVLLLREFNIPDENGAAPTILGRKSVKSLRHPSQRPFDRQALAVSTVTPIVRTVSRSPGFHASRGPVTRSMNYRTLAAYTGP